MEATKRALNYREAATWNGLENNVKAELNLNCFMSALTLSKNGSELEAVAIYTFFFYLIL